jgi:hypothetical protein
LIHVLKSIAVVVGVVSGLAIAGCGSDETTTDSGSGTGAGDSAAAPAPATAFDAVTVALEGQGLAVSKLPPSSLDGAETGISVSGDHSGSALLFKSGQEAQAYSKQATKAGDSTKVVGTVVFEADSQADADFLADAYED